MNATSERLELLQRALTALSGREETPTGAEHLAQACMRSARFILSFDRHGLPRLQIIPPGAVVFAPEELPEILADPMGPVPRRLIPRLIEALARRMA